MARITALIYTQGITIYFTILIVTLEQLSGSTTCSGSTTVIRCETNVTEVLEWRDTNGNMVRFTRSGDDPGASGSLGPVFVNITEEIGSTLVSQATVTNTSTNVLLTCRNDVFTEIVTVTLEGDLCVL